MTSLPATLLQAFGRLHVVLVHFPIALILAAALIELVSGRRAGESRSPAAFACLLLGALSAVVTALSGWVNAAFEPHARSIADTLLLHRWMGVATAVLSLATLLAARVAGRTAYRTALFLTAAVVAVEAHLGGTLVHGEGYLTELFRAPEQPAHEHPAAPVDAAREPPESPRSPESPESPEPPQPPDAPVEEPERTGPPEPPDLTAQVRAIFAERCEKCHGPKKAKGKLRLNDLDAVLARPAAHRVILPGDPQGSELYRRISLPADDDDVMPGAGEPLTPEQIETIAAWIRSLAPGSSGPAPGGTAEPAPASNETGSAAPPIPRGPAPPAPTEPAPADAVARLASSGAYVSPVSLESPDLEVSLSLLGPEAGDADLAPLAELEPWVVSLDLSRTSVTDDGLAALDGLTRLRRLRLDWTAVTDAGLRHVSRLPSLELLNLVGTAVTDAGLARLASLAGLRRLFLWHTGVTPAGADALRAELPELELQLGDEAGGEAGGEPARQ